MRELHVELENCYGIRALSAVFDFSKSVVFAIYAPNGAMKSSLAQTFKDVADSKPSKDRVFPSRACKRSITDENGNEIAPETVLVIRPYDEFFGHTEKTSTLLVDAKLRTEYEQLHEDINKSKAALAKALKAQSGSRKDIEAEVSSTFTKSADQFYLALTRVKDELMAQPDAPFAAIQYDVIFDEKVLALLATKDFKTAIADYVRKYNELLAASTYFKRGTFNYYNAATIAKSLADNGFFDAKHTVRLNADEVLDINSVQQLEDLIAREKEGISNDPDLRKKFTDIEKLITKNANVREFQSYLEDHEELLPELANVENLREKLWKSYLKACQELYEDTLDKYRAADKRQREIKEEASKQRTQWEAVIEIFNSRFFVPFKLVAKNRVSVILGEEAMLSLGFVFEDGDDVAEVERNDLLQVLSSGEKKALYILNVRFEIEVRRRGAQETVFVIDDIADSFDYKNKYAIIQYLRDIAQEGQFREMILTHNFDFFRTLNSRFVPYSNCLMAVRSSEGVVLHQAHGIQNIFVNDWKKAFFTDPRKRIASVPFIRNILEYTKGADDADYAKLTALLHWKADSSTITQAELDRIFKSVFGGSGAWTDGNQAVLACLDAEACGCLSAGDGANFENKIVLAIAIRLAAERFMEEAINDPAFVASITSNQTSALFAKYRDVYPNSTEALEVIDLVLLMTPENIHLNSFMYEPILDMSDEHLRKLYERVSSLGKRT